MMSKEQTALVLRRARLWSTSVRRNEAATCIAAGINNILSQLLILIIAALFVKFLCLRTYEFDRE